MFYETVSSLNKTPVILALGGECLRKSRSEGAAIDGDWFAAFMFQSLYSTPLIPCRGPSLTRVTATGPS